MNVYVAGRDPELSAAVMDVCRQQGYVVTLDWTNYGKGVRVPAIAEMMKIAVKAADVLILCRVEDGMLGALLETGMAIAYDKPVIVYGAGEPQRDSLFWLLPQVEVCEALTTLQDKLAEKDRMPR